MPMCNDGIRTSLSARNWSAALFDLDGVLTDTARVHAADWQVMFGEVLCHCAAEAGEAVHSFDPRTNNPACVDGR